MGELSSAVSLRVRPEPKNDDFIFIIKRYVIISQKNKTFHWESKFPS